MSPPIRRYPDFMSSTVADAWFERLQIRDWRGYQIKMFGRMVDEPRLIDWCGEHAYVYSRRVLEPRAVEPDLRGLMRQVSEQVGVEFNHCLMNYYRDGQDSMGWHCDDEPELGPDPVIASVSLGAERDFQFRVMTGEKRPSQTIRLKHGELLVMEAGCQAAWQHQLPKRAHSAPRINLTFRRVFSTSSD